MRIKELYIKNFGKFSETRFTFSDGIQVFYGENEYGKSTIYAFIKAMLFGLERGRGRAANKDDFSRYEPWENPVNYAGSMRFVCGGKNFYLERRFDRYAKRSVLICEDDGEELSVEDGDLDMLLGGMSRAAFENTAAVGQLSAKPGESLAAELKNYAANYYEAGSSEVDVQRALQVLNEKRKDTVREINRLQQEEEKKANALKVQYDYIKEEQETGIERLKEIKKDLEKEKSKNQSTVTTEKHVDKGKRCWFYVGICMAAAGCLLAGTGAAGLLRPAILPGILLLAAGIVCIAAGAVHRGGTEKAESVSGTEEAGEQEEAKLRWEAGRLAEELRDKKVRLENLKEQIDEAELPGEALRKLQIRKQALELAEEKIREASANMTQEFGTRLNRAASAILGEITEGRYGALQVDDGLRISVYGDGRRVPAERLSRGTIEQVYFALRMAVLDLLYEESIPVILDDAFAFYDEKRLKSALKWLSCQSRQVIIFSCQRREEEIVKDECL